MSDKIITKALFSPLNDYNYFFSNSEGEIHMVDAWESSKYS